MRNETESGFEEILRQMNKDGSFTASVLASEDGLPIAFDPHPSPYDADTIAAMVTLVKEFIQQAQTRIGLANVDEVSMVVEDHSRLVCRYFTAGKQSFILAVFVPSHQSYRRVTTRAVREMQALWTTPSP
jgi:predicted regulator of Ras-like GTPase activity (Roadblock/LC7/MglB family)